MKKFLALGLLAVSTVTLLASCSSSTKENLNSRPISLDKREPVSKKILPVTEEDSLK